jgi:hypothetical protein
MRTITSRENVEKVVKAPRIPTVRNALNSAVGCQTNVPDSYNTPKMKDPITFTVKVAQGILEPNQCDT